MAKRRKKSRNKKKGKKRVRIVITVRGDLSQFGYKMRNKASTRLKALKQAVKRYGYAPVIRKLNALRVLNKNRNPRFSRMVENDMKKLREWWEKRRRG